MTAADVETYTIAGAFLLGAVLATVATLRLLRVVVDYFAAVDRHRPGRRRRDDDE
jgi:hypothetical protein